MRWGLCGAVTPPQEKLSVSRQKVTCFKRGDFHVRVSCQLGKIIGQTLSTSHTMSSCTSMQTELWKMCPLHDHKLQVLKKNSKALNYNFIFIYYQSNYLHLQFAFKYQSSLLRYRELKLLQFSQGELDLHRGQILTFNKKFAQMELQTNHTLILFIGFLFFSCLSPVNFCKSIHF